MKMTVYRYRVWDYQHDDCAYIPPHYATREYIQQLEGTTIIEYAPLEVDQSYLDPQGRIAIFERATHAVEGLATSSEDGLVLGEFVNEEDKD
jgi:hypothetical protein